jgi:hypothetical protein
MSDQHVLAFFPDELAADNAVAALKVSGIIHHDAIGILALDSDGKLKQDKLGARSTGKGAAIGDVLAVFSAAFLGPAVLGCVAVGALHHKNVGLSDADKARLTVELKEGQAAIGVTGLRIGVTGHRDIRDAISEELTQLGGTPESYELTDEILQAARADTEAV